MLKMRRNQELTRRISLLMSLRTNVAFHWIVRLQGKVRFLLGGRGWAGASEGRVISQFFTNWGGSNLFYSQLGKGHCFSWEGKKFIHVA